MIEIATSIAPAITDIRIKTILYQLVRLTVPAGCMIDASSKTGRSLRQPFRPIDRLVQLLDSVGVLRPLQRQRLIREFPILANRPDQVRECVLSISESFSYTVFYQSAFEINCLSGGRR